MLNALRFNEFLASNPNSVETTSKADYDRPAYPQAQGTTLKLQCSKHQYCSEKPTREAQDPRTHLPYYFEIAAPPQCVPDPGRAQTSNFALISAFLKRGWNEHTGTEKRDHLLSESWSVLGERVSLAGNVPRTRFKRRIPVTAG
jgi:hypothetical protein